MNDSQLSAVGAPQLALSPATGMASAPRFDRDLGKVTNTMRHTRFAKPAAKGNRSTRNGLKGNVVSSGCDRCLKSFKTPGIDTNIFLIGVAH